MKKSIILLLFIIPLLGIGQHNIPESATTPFYGARKFVGLNAEDTLAIYFNSDTIFFTGTDPIYIDNLVNSQSTQNITLTGDVTGSGTNSITTTIGNGKVDADNLNSDIINGQTYTNIITEYDKFMFDYNNSLYYTQAHYLKSYMTNIYDVRTTTLSEANSTSEFTVFTTTLDRNLPHEGMQFEIFLSGDIQIETNGEQLDITLKINGSKIFTIYDIATQTSDMWKNVITWKGTLRGSNIVCNSVQYLGKESRWDTGKLYTVSLSTDPVFSITYKLSEANTGTKFNIYQSGMQIKN